MIAVSPWLFLVTRQPLSADTTVLGTSPEDLPIGQVEITATSYREPGHLSNRRALQTISSGFNLSFGACWTCCPTHT